MSAKSKKPSAEEVWEKAGYLSAAADACVDFDTLLDAVLDAEDADAGLDYDAGAAAYARGRARWLAEHPEDRA